MENRTIIDRKTGEKHDLYSLEAVRMLFPGFEKGERIAFINAHDDDALAGVPMTICNLIEQYDVDAHFLILSDGRNGFDPVATLNNNPWLIPQWHAKYTRPNLNVSKDFNLEKDIFMRYIGNLSMEEILKEMKSNGQYKSEISKLMFDYIAGIRKRETIEGYSVLGVPRENLHYYTYDGIHTIPDYDIVQFQGYTAGQSDRHKSLNVGIMQWLPKTLRELKPSRVLALNVGDPHPDHQLAAQLALNGTRRALGNLWHLGEPIKIKPSAEGTLGLYYMIFELMPEHMGKPRYIFQGTDEDVEIKKEAFSKFKSQSMSLACQMSMPDIKQEYFHPFPSLQKDITAVAGYHIF